MLPAKVWTGPVCGSCAAGELAGCTGLLVGATFVFSGGLVTGGACSAPLVGGVFFVVFDEVFVTGAGDDATS
jgi:hypothetical protein